MLEAISLCEEITGRTLDWRLSHQARRGDHRWWISDVSDFAAEYTSWQPRYGIEEMLQEIYEENFERWTATSRPA